MDKPVTVQNVFQSFIDQKPFMIGRCGNVEVSSLVGDDRQIRTNAGFYGTDEDLKKFKKIYYEAIKSCDIMMNVITCNSFRMIEDFYTANYIYIPQIPYLEYCDLYLQTMSLLSTRHKIGFVSSFDKDMEEQAPKLGKVWNGQFAFNHKNFVFVHSYNTTELQEKPHKNYLETLEDLSARVLAHDDVDYWFLGCGCYGLPLAKILKDNKKNSIYIGGLIQILFGIMGQRWRDRKEITSQMNFHWLGSSQQVPIKDLNKYMAIEGGCYI
jgi:hypothetical protein